ncbi:MAG: MBL fold metallo-hydrolase [Planctomycetaceae bacterium]
MSVVRVSSQPPSAEAASRVAEGVWWVRLQLNESYDHVNTYLLDNGETWTLVDTGINSADCRTAFQRLLASKPFCEKPVGSVLITHYHPDHIGLAGWFCDQGASLVTTRTTWLSACVLLTQPTEALESALEFFRRHGMSSMECEAYRRSGAHDRYCRLVSAIPAHYRRIQQNDTLTIGRRQWTVKTGHGHAAEHATLWSDDGLAIVGDQILAGISPSLQVHPSEPFADVIGEWLDSCRQLAACGHDGTLCLPGHNLPFTDAPKRCQQLAESQRAVLQRLLEGLNHPRNTMDCIDLVSPREVLPDNRASQLLRTVGYLNHLQKNGLITCSRFEEQYIWKRQRPQFDFSTGSGQFGASLTTEQAQR